MKQITLPVRSHAIRVTREVGLGSLRAEGRLRSARPRRSATRLRIVACSPTYLPTHRRGAEVTLHDVLVELVRRGHEVRVIVGDDRTSEVIDGVTVVSTARGRAEVAHGAWSDVVIGQLSARWQGAALAARARRPFVYFVHIGNVARRSQFGRPDLTVFNSDVVRDQQPWVEPAIVVHPPVRRDDYATTPGDAITLVNLTRPKGAELFAELARRLPERRFLGVQGPDASELAGAPPANVTTLAQVDDMRDVYGRTRVLLVPSVYEAYGRVALEAGWSGIPTIAHPTDGMREALGDAAVWVDRDDADAWVSHIEQLDDPEEYATRAERVRTRVEALDPAHEIDDLERALVALAGGEGRW